MDEYGYYASAQMGVRLFEQMSRGSGRTLRLIERVSDGDQIIVPSENIRRDIRHRLKEAGKSKVDVRVLYPGDHPLERGFAGMSHGRTFFEHTWVLEYFLINLEHSEKSLDTMQRELSKTWPEKPEYDQSALNIIRMRP